MDDDPIVQLAELRARPKADPPLPISPGRPIVQILDGRLPHVIDAAEQVFIHSEPEIFEFSGDPVYLGEEPPLKNHLAAYRRRVAFRYESAHLADHWTRLVDFQKFDGRSHKWRSVDCPEKIATAYIQRKGRRRIPRLRAIISAPTLLADGSILATPGYNSDTGLFYDPCGLTYPDIPEAPSYEDAREALNELIEPIRLFPFVPDSDAKEGSSARSVTLSAMLTSLVRASLPTSPLHSSSAPDAGTGKSMLDNIVAMLATGRTCHPIAETETTEEFEKRLSTASIKGSQIIGFDNCVVPLESGLLCQAITEPVISIRNFGVLKDIEIENVCLILANGNNLVLKGDIVRRTLRAILDAKVERPELRTFNFSPLKLVAQHRPKLVVAGLTVLRAYHVAKRPDQNLDPFGSFEEWSAWVRSALVWLGEPDPCLTVAAARETDPDLKRLRSLLVTWKDLFSTGATIKRALEEARTYSKDDLALMEKRSALLNAMEQIAGNRGEINTRTLGNWIARYQGKVVADLHFKEDGTNQHATLWKVEEKQDSK